MRRVCRPVQLLPKASWSISRRDHSGGHATSDIMGTYAFTRCCIIIVEMLRDVSLSPASLVISLLPLGLAEAHWCPWPMRNFIHYVSQQSCIANVYKLQCTDNFYYGIFYIVLFLLWYYWWLQLVAMLFLRRRLHTAWYITFGIIVIILRFFHHIVFSHTILLLPV